MSYESIFDSDYVKKVDAAALYPPFFACPGKCYNKKFGIVEPNPNHISLLPRNIQKVIPEKNVQPVQIIAEQPNHNQPNSNQPNSNQPNSNQPNHNQPNHNQPNHNQPVHPYASIFQNVQLHEKIMLPPHRIELILAKIDQMRKVPISTVLRMAEEILPSDVVTILRAMNPDEVKQMYDSTSTEELAELLLKICSPAQLSTLLTLDVSSHLNVEAYDSFDSNLSYITEKIAVGNHLSNYQPFDVIVNLNYPQNGVNRYEIHRSTEGTKKIYKIGLLDGPDEPMGDILKQLIPELLAIEPEPKILFHCYAGISRSSTCAAAYYAKKNKVSAEEALKVLVEKRSIIRPNPGFLQALQTYVA